MSLFKEVIKNSPEQNNSLKLFDESINYMLDGKRVIYFDFKDISKSVFLIDRTRLNLDLENLLIYSDSEIVDYSRIPPLFEGFGNSIICINSIGSFLKQSGFDSIESLRIHCETKNVNLMFCN